MSLYEVADGVLCTHVTWNDVEVELQKKFGTNATFGENRTATNIGDMKGFMSRIALVEPDWVGVEEGKQLPERFVVKIASQMALLELFKARKDVGDDDDKKERLKMMAQHTRNCHNVEVESYKLLEQFNHPDIPFTRVYGYKKFQAEHDLKGFIISEFVPNVENTIFESLTPNEAATVIRAIATFSALEFQRSEPIQIVENYVDCLFKEFVGEENLKQQLESLRDCLKNEDEKKADQLIETYWHYFKLLPKYSKLSELLDAKTVLNHGDLWQANLLYSKNKEGVKELKAIIDWQGCSRLHLGLDLARFLIGCLSIQDRRANFMSLLRLYHDTFTSTLGRELFSFQELLDSYNLYFPMMAMMIQPSMMKFLETAEMPEPEKEMLRQGLLTHSVGIMEDVLKVHEENLLKFPEFMKF